MQKHSRRAATVADVATTAKVSKATAARALGGYGAVSARVRERVLAAAAELGYLPNEMARSMSTGRSRTVGIIIGDIENPAFAQATGGAADAAEAAGFELVLSNSKELVETERTAINTLLAKRVDGFVIAPASSSDPANYQLIIDSGRPLTLFDRMVHGLPVDAVIGSNREGAAELARVLTAAGHRRIGFISTLADDAGGLRERIRIAADGSVSFSPRLASSVIEDRIAGLAEELLHAGVADPLRDVRINTTPELIPGIVEDLMAGPDGVTAIVASDSIGAIQVFRSLRERGLSIPHDLSLVAFDDADWTSVSEPGITVMAQQEREIGALATRLLIERIEGSTAAPTTHSIPQRLIERGSVGAPPARA